MYKKQLNALNRIACKSATVITRITPQASLELIFNLMPLDLHIKLLGLTTYCRIKKKQSNKSWSPNNSPAIPHLKYWENHLSKLDINEEDDRCNEIIWKRKTNVMISKPERKIIHAETTIYTDGSKMEEGFVVYNKNKIETLDHTPLPNSYTVFMAEIQAKLAAGEYIQTCLLYTSPSPRDS